MAARRYGQFCPVTMASEVLGERRSRFWLIVDMNAEESPVDRCIRDPGHAVDLYVTADLRTLTALWMGITSVRQALDSGSLVVDRRNRSRMPSHSFVRFRCCAQPVPQVPPRDDLDVRARAAARAVVPDNRRNRP